VAGGIEREDDPEDEPHSHDSANLALGPEGFLSAAAPGHYLGPSTLKRLARSIRADLKFVWSFLTLLGWSRAFNVSPGDRRGILNRKTPAGTNFVGTESRRLKYNGLILNFS